jgi:hypothetical protein
MIQNLFEFFEKPILTTLIIIDKKYGLKLPINNFSTILSSNR